MGDQDVLSAGFLTRLYFKDEGRCLILHVVTGLSSLALIFEADGRRGRFREVLVHQEQQNSDKSKILKAQEDEIKAILRDAIGTNDELLINGAKVASISRWREFGLVTDTVKTTFPIAEYPELYKAATKSRLNVH